MEIPIAAELIGSVKIIPIKTETMIPPNIGDCSTFTLTSPPSHFIKSVMYGPTNKPIAAPAQIEISGVTRISTFVFPATRWPTSIAT
jgi:hypothetical protein